MQPSSKHLTRLLSLSVIAYQALLVAYPTRFRKDYRAEMVLVFRDLCREQMVREGVAGFSKLLGITFLDLITTAYKERSAAMQKNLNASLAGGALLIPGLVFLVFMSSIYGLGVKSFEGPFNMLYGDPKLIFWRRLADVFILLGPLAAILVSLRPVLKAIHLNPGGDSLATITLTKQSLVALTILTIGLGMTAVFGVYFVLENWQCIIGAKISC